MSEEKLDKILDTVQDFKKKDQAGKGGTIAAIVAGILALVAVAIFAWKAWQAGKERAKLLHEKAVLEEKEHQADVDAELAECIDRRGELLDEALTLREEIHALEDAATRLEQERRAARNMINKISTWEDIDEIVR